MSAQPTDPGHKVRPELLDRLVSVGDLHNHPRNPRRGDIDMIAASLDRFGQVSPILATREGTIVKGNHTYRAALKLGWTHVAATLMDLSKDDADAYLVADNRASELGEFDQRELLALVTDLDSRDLLAGVGYDADSLAELRDLVAELPPPPADSADPDDPDAEPGDDDDDEVERGAKLDRLDVSIAEPKTELGPGALVRLGHHYLFVESVYHGFALWGQVLAENPERLFIPYPMPTVPLTGRADREPLVMVQPDTYLAGHLVDKWVSVKGDEDVEIIRRHR